MIPKTAAMLPAIVLSAASLMAADPDINVLKNSGALDRLLKKSGVYNASSTGKTPNFVVDPSWPQPLPNNWLVGQIGGLYVDPHDHVWVYNRARTMTTEEAGLEGPVPGAKDPEGQPVNGIGHARAYGAVADCCKAAPSVLEFDADGKLLRAWGGPSAPQPSGRDRSAARPPRRRTAICRRGRRSDARPGSRRSWHRSRSRTR